MWTEPLFRALRDGVRTIRLSDKYQNESGEYVESAYTIDCINVTHVTQQNLSSGKRRALRAVYINAARLHPPGSATDRVSCTSGGP